MAGDSILSITEVPSFKEVIEKNARVVVDFTATWCGPCKLISPVFQKLSAEFGDKIAFIKVDVDEGAEIAGNVGVRAMPTFKFFLNGKQVSDLEVVGADKTNLRANIEKLAALGDRPAEEQQPADEEKPAEEQKPEAST
ncbi:hypothetical protein IW140_001712 [Coemansia sp. RSA 1813]|nr:hypothetical protein EV178_001508 [Coemansia sp. RSA 1646]KAJ1772511.1 hypothetical protein LPJ74_001412 [Coemansia sp. RSA 1843]KAJ2214018.1 hypothetical protein EV179_003373 [Coemansia sp. RSA 487]KAJ2571258.1 hypothetical protein IW140_001712 [Coemansia sp. RSA 1813]